MVERALWAAAIATYTVADTAMTIHGMRQHSEEFEELNPVTNRILKSGGAVGFAGVKAGVTVLSYGGYAYLKADPETAPFAKLVPAALATMGTVAVANNALHEAIVHS